MKKLVILFLVLLLGFVSASVDVHNYTIDGYYYPFDKIRGEVNLTISGEDFFSKVTSNDGAEMLLSDFLILNGVDYKCFPPDCSNNYNVLGGSENWVVAVDSGEVSYAGFVLNGDDVVVTGIDFDIESDFGEGSNRPIVIDFFEGEGWEFNDFSDSYSSKNWGCYSLDYNEVGPPIRKSTYCEMIHISDTGSLFVGAYVDDGDDVDLKMFVYPKQGGTVLGSCLFTPGVEDGCEIDAEVDEIFFEGDYQVCVSAPSSSVTTNYFLYQDSVGENCGFVYSVGPWNSVEDYAIFAREAKFSDASYLGKEDIDFSDLVVAANELIKERYDGDCSDGCILPFAVSGVSQDVKIFNINIDYFDGGRDAFTRKVNNLEMLPVLVDFSGVLDFGILDFDIFRSMKYVISIDNKVILSEDLKVLPAPIVSSLFPLNPPAGVPVEFYVFVNFSGNGSLVYDWDFGDGNSETTYVPKVVHSYGDLGNYSLKVMARVGNLTGEKVFVINAISPRDAVDISLGLKNNSLSGVDKSISDFSFWYEDELRDILDLDFFIDEIGRLFKLRANASVDDDFLEIAKGLYSLNIPVGLVLGEYGGHYLMTDLMDVHPEIVALLENGKWKMENGNLDNYREPILNWQVQNIDVDFSVEEVVVFWWNGDSGEVVTAYSFDVFSYEEGESYFVINKPIDDLIFRSNVGAVGVGGATVIEMEEGEKKSFDFYYEGSDDVSFFASPRLSTILIEEDIDTSCNYNLVCEDGENSKSCRSDCKPIVGAIVYGILGLVVVLIFYTLLVIWYKRRYENYLFGNRGQLYNLLMYIANARARGFEYSRIAASLRKQGWSSERVRYAIRKSRGQRTGMIEIIPISLIGAMLRNRRAARNVGTRMNADF